MNLKGEAFRIFADNENYNESILISYCDLLKDIYHGTIMDGDVCLSNLIKRIETLTQLQQNVLESRYGLNGSEPLTLKETAKKYGVSMDVVRNNQDKAIRIMRHPLNTVKTSLIIKK